MRRYRSTASNPASRAVLIATDGATPWAKKIKEFERLCAHLRQRSAIAQIDYSIFVFDLNDDEINRALYGPPAELTQDVCVSGY